MRHLNALLAAATLAIALAGVPDHLAAAHSGTLPEQTGGLTGSQAGTATPTVGASPSPSPQTTPAASPAATVAATPVANATVSPGFVLPTATPTPIVSPTLEAITVTIPGAAPAATETPAVTVTLGVTVATVVAPASAIGQETAQGAIAGTVIANRTQSAVRFFAEGSTFTLEPLRSMGLNLARPTGVLNLYNCDIALGESQEGCYWDPYLLTKDGFYEIVSGRDAGAAVGLILREAGQPPANQIWIQNRTGVAEEVYFGTQMRALPAGSVQEFPLENSAVGIFYLRTCIASAAGEVCEWSAHSAEPGGYYALVEESFSGGLPGTTVSNLELQPVLASAPAVGSAPAATAAPQMVCRLAVPALNVRSGPGLEFDIIAKVRSTDIEIATILVVGRTEDGGWLQVDERVANRGWVIAGSEYLTCDGDIMALPAAPASELPPTPTPLPVVAALPADTAPASIDATAGVAPTETTPITGTDPAQTGGPAAPAGLAMLTLHNAFDRFMRVTVDQRYRPEIGPSEFDLEPGQSVSVAVFPGVLAYSASSVVSGMGGNAELFLNPDESRAVFIYFEYDTIDKKWLMRTN